MTNNIIIRNVCIVNEGQLQVGDVWVLNGIIQKIGGHISLTNQGEEINGEGLHLLPGVIDDQVHFREPGLTHKGNIYTESRAAIAGGITSYMEMPNTSPPATTQQLLQDKYDIAAHTSLANYSFYMGTTNNNSDEVLRTHRQHVCGVKIFMGSSTGDMLVDNVHTLQHIFANCELLIATHCEDEQTIKQNIDKYKAQYGDNAIATIHPLVRNTEACYLSSSFAVAMARKHHTRLHVLHISSAKETSLFTNDLPLSAKRITSEACIHHLWFCDHDYADKQNLIKWNPAIKSATDRDAIWAALLDNRIDVIATDHAPHTIEEKKQHYWNAPSGGPLVQHALIAMLTAASMGKISISRVVEKMCHAPAQCFNVYNRGYIREGYYADLVLVDLKRPYVVNSENILYKCGWSPFMDTTFTATVTHTIVNGNVVYADGKVYEPRMGMRLEFHKNH